MDRNSFVHPLGKREAHVKVDHLELKQKPLREPARFNQTYSKPIALNIGGTVFETSVDTLMPCTYFQAMIHGGFSGASHEDRFFVDRDPVLFSHLLSFLRTRRRPSERVIKELGDELILECEYYGCDDFLHELRGDTNPFDMRQVDRQMLREEETCASTFYQRDELENYELRQWEQRLLINVFAQPPSMFSREDATQLQLPLLYHNADSPLSDSSFDNRCKDVHTCRTHSSGEDVPTSYCQASTRSSLSVRTFADFRSAFNTLTDDLLNDIGDSRGFFFAGGSVLSALTGTSCSDIDIFLVGSSKFAHEKFEQLLTAVKQNKKKTATPDGKPSDRLLVSRTKNCVTMYRNMTPDTPQQLPVQLVLTLYRSPLEVLLNFDVDCCCVLYDMSGEKVYCLPRARRALNYKCNVANTQMRSPTYERRLHKYASRGFAVAVPGLNLSRIDKALFEAEYFHDPDSGKLFRLGDARLLHEKATRQVSVWHDAHTTAKKTFQLLAELERPAVQVTGLQLLLVLGASPPSPIQVHLTNKFEEQLLGRAAFHVLSLGTRSSQTVLLACSPQTLTTHHLLQSSAEESSSEDESSASMAKVFKMLNMARTAVTEQMLMSAEPSDVEKTARDLPPRETGLDLGELASRFQHICLRRLAHNVPIGVIYDVISIEDTTLSDLHYVCDARRGCLERVDESVFEKKTGVPRFMEFRTSLQNMSSLHLGLRAKAEYHVQRGSWFTGVY